jgi:CNT family concentrative nucleoside transporter
VATLRSSFGYELLSFLGNQIESFLGFANYGSRLVFGENFADHFFAFKVRIDWLFNLIE